jgi:hypothetical protein
MAAKDTNPFPSPRKRVAKGALAVAIALLQDERVRDQLRRAPAAARTWAERRRAAASTATAGTAATGDLRTRLDPTRRFGQKGIERRLAALRRNVALAFPEPTSPDATTIADALDELDRAAAIAATMPLRERRRTHARIGAEIGRLEAALVDAVLPPERPSDHEQVPGG